MPPTEERQRKPWERRPDETARAYGAFCVYRDLGPDRTLTLAVRTHLTRTTANARATGAQRDRARYLTHLTPGKYLRNVRRKWGEWSRTKAWVARCAEYDAWVQAEGDRRAADAVIAEADRQAQENVRRAALRISDARDLQDAARKALALALPVALIRLQTAGTELRELQRAGATPVELARASKKATEDAVNILHWIVKALPVGQKQELLGIGEVTDRANLRVEGDGLAAQIATLLIGAAESGDLSLPALAALREQLADSDGGNGRAEM